MIGKSKTLPVDQLFLDLEDAVATEVKVKARSIISKTFEDIKGGSDGFLAELVSIRINGVKTPWIDEDLSILADGCGRYIYSVILPKSSDIEELRWLDDQLSRVERTCGREEGTIVVDAQIESALGIVNVDAIASAPRVSLLAFGPADFMADLGMPSAKVMSQPLGYEIADAFHYPMMRILIAAQAVGIAAIDGPILDVHNIEKFRKSALRSYALGFDGK